MSKLILFDFVCDSCGHQFEELVQPEVYLNVECPTCISGNSHRLPSAGKINYRVMGVDPDFPTAGDKWAKMQIQRREVEKARDL